VSPPQPEFLEYLVSIQFIILRLNTPKRSDWEAAKYIEIFILSIRSQKNNVSLGFLSW